ncbi:MAG: trigger factor [Cyanobacteriota bacterium]|jgi:trigger factor
MKVTQEKLPASRLRLAIEIPADQSRKAHEATLKQLANTVRIPGFRPGKIPRPVLIQRLGAGYIKAKVLEDLISSTYQNALSQEKIAPISQPEFVQAFDNMVGLFTPGQDFTYEVLVDVFPSVELGDIDGLAVEAEEVEFKPQWVEDWLANKQSDLATLVPIEDRGAELGDVVIIDHRGYRLAEGGGAGEEIPELKGENLKLDLSPDKLQIQGVVEGMTGMTLGETRQISVQFPEEYNVETLQGSTALLEVTLKELKAKELPELDDDFAAEVGEEYGSLEQLKEHLAEQFQTQVQQQRDNNLDQAVLTALLERCPLELSETAIEAEITQQLQQTLAQMRQMGLSDVQLQQIFAPENLPSLREEARPNAIQVLSGRLIYLKIAETQNLKPNPKAVEDRATEMALLFKSQGQTYDKAQIENYVREEFAIQAVQTWLRDKVKVTWTAPKSEAKGEGETGAG